MIEFTLDELEMINTAVSIYEKRIYGNSNKTRFTPILIKIGRMIDDATPISNPEAIDTVRIIND
jgi:hypothetical protein